MTDQPPAGAGQPNPGAGRDEAQPGSTPRPDWDDTKAYTPAPEPRSPWGTSAWDARVAPEPYDSGSTPVDQPAWSGPAQQASWSTQPRAWEQPPVTTPVARVHARRSARGSVFGPVLVASLLSAVLASGGTLAVLKGSGALERPAAAPSTPTGALTGAGNQPLTIDESSAIIEAAAKVSPAVVRITARGVNTDVFGGQIPESGVGSGVIYDARGWILTNRHVVADSEQLTVELKDGREFDGEVYGVDTLTDLAIVKIEGADFPTAPVGDSSELQVGQLTIAIGSPLGTYSNTVTSGIVSATGRTIEVQDDTILRNLIQTDAAINPGNSGGPLIDAVGNVIGINTAVALDSNGIGFAIPINIARPIMQQALAGQELARPYIGIQFVTLDQQRAQDNDLPVDQGAWVVVLDPQTERPNGENAIRDDSPALAAGVETGDIIVAIEGVAIDNEHPLDAVLSQFAPGQTVEVTLLRGDARDMVPVTLGTRPPDLAP
jgi:serine protease Do